MKAIKKKFAFLGAICCACLLLISGSGIPVNAAGSLLPAACDNLSIGLRVESELVATDDGYIRVYYDGEKVGIEYYDEEFHILSKKSLAMELELWGGFYAGKDAYYLVEGQNNTEESDTAEVIRVIKYDEEWNRIGAANITGNTNLFGGEVRYPFDVGCVEFAECNGTLYIVTGHEGYVDSLYGQGHQGFLMLAVDVETMEGQIDDADLWHSFAQYIASEDSNLYVLEQSEGSRYTKLARYDTDAMTYESIPVLEYGGSTTSAWALPCYASVDGIALSSENVLSIGTSIDQSLYDEVDSTTAHNIYLTVTPKADFTQDATTVKWLTDFSGNGECFYGVKITKINEDRFMISWEMEGESGTASDDDTLSGSVLHYVFVDGAGNVIGDEHTAAAPISDCQPILNGSKIVYYASNSNMVNFYTIDAQTGEFSKKSYRVAGENVTWNYADGVLTISGTGPMDVDASTNYRYPISSTGGYYSTGANSWSVIAEKTEKIVIESGVTSIPEKAFANFESLKEVVIEPGLESIGAKAFYGCESLRKITIPASVTEIGEDFLWTGYYWISDDSHVVYATIYTEDCSYAIEYAEENNIRVVIEHEYGDWVVTTEPTCTATGTQRRDCEKCDAYETSTVPAKGHEWNSEPTVDIEPTCTKTGSQSIHCKNCTATKNLSTVDKIAHKTELKNVKAKTCTTDGYTGDKVCTACGTTVGTGTVIKATGHDFDSGKITTEATRGNPGIKTYTCKVCKATKTESVPYLADVVRIYGATRYETSYAIADALKEELGVDKFSIVIVADGTNFPDALAGSYLAAKTDAPILMVDGKKSDSIKELHAYIKANLETDGKIYILGGTNALPETVESGLESYELERLSGKDRYETNLLILKEAGVEDEDILVCTGTGFADSLSGSATEKPILLVNKELTTNQKAFLAAIEGNKFYVIGGKAAVSEDIEKAIRTYRATERIGGKDRYETSTMLAEEFFENPEAAVIAYAWNFPDGLCGGPLAASLDAPLLLTGADTAKNPNAATEASAAKVAIEYMEDNNIGDGAVLGGQKVMSDNTVRLVFGMEKNDKIINKPFVK